MRPGLPLLRAAEPAGLCGRVRPRGEDPLGCGAETPGRGAAATPERLVLSFSEQPLSAQQFEANGEAVHLDTPGLAEVTVLIRRGGRVVPVAMRLDGAKGHWELVELQY